MRKGKDKYFYLFTFPFKDYEGSIENTAEIRGHEL
jgi:hypothetical protein